MKRLALALAITLLTSACGGSRTFVLSRTKGSIVRVLDSSGGVCTGFPVAPKKVLTAQHCDSKDLTFDGLKGKEIDSDEYFDLLLYEVPDLKKAPLRFRGSPVSKEEVLYGVGYGLGWTKPFELTHIVSIINGPSYIHESSKHPMGIITQQGFVAGMSGGPLVDTLGRVVGVITQDSEYMTGYAVNVTDIRAFLLNDDIEVP